MALSKLVKRCLSMCSEIGGQDIKKATPAGQKLKPKDHKPSCVGRINAFLIKPQLHDGVKRITIYLVDNYLASNKSICCYAEPGTNRHGICLKNRKKGCVIFSSMTVWFSWRRCSGSDNLLFMGVKWCEVQAGMHFLVIIDTNLAIFFRALVFKENGASLLKDGMILCNR